MLAHQSVLAWALRNLKSNANVYVCTCVYINVYLSSDLRAVSLLRLPTKQSILRWGSICCLVSLCLPHLSNTWKNLSSLLTLTEFRGKRRKCGILVLFSSVLNFVCSMLTHKVVELNSTRFPKSNKNLTFFSFPAITILLQTPNILDLLMANLGEGGLEVLQ